MLELPVGSEDHHISRSFIHLTKHICMKLTTILLSFLLLHTPDTLSAQWKRETGFTLGVVSPDYPEGRFSYGVPGSLLKLGFAQCWYNPEHRISFRPELNLNTEFIQIGYSHGGKPAGGTHEGNIFAITSGLATMAQIRILPGTTVAFGPSGKFLLTDITKTVYTYDGGYILPDVYISKEFNGFNREYLNKPSLGIKTMLIQKNLNGKINMGLVFDYQWKNSEEDYFYFSRTMEISFYLGL